MRILLFRQPCVYSVPVLSSPMGIVATILKHAGHDVKVIDNNSIYYRMYSDRDLLKIIEQQKPDVIGFNITILNAYRTYSFLAKVQKRFPDLPAVGGGIHMKTSFEEALRHGCDVTIVREGEKIVVPLFEHLCRKGKKGFREMIPYGRQSISEEDIAAVASVLRSDWLTTGPAVDNFERALAEKAGVAHCVAVSSGTAALHSAAFAAGLGPGVANSSFIR